MFFISFFTFLKKYISKTYEKMVSLIHFRKDRLIDKGAFKNQEEINTHVSMIESEILNTEKKSRMKELENWINYLYDN